MLDCDMLLAGLAGRPPTWPVMAVKGDGEARGAFEGAVALPLTEAGCAVATPAAVLARPVGVGWGVEAAEFAFATEIGAGEGLALAVFAGG